MPREKYNLLEKDFCVNGHDVRDKDKSLRIGTTANGRYAYTACKACGYEAIKRHRDRVKSGTAKEPRPRKMATQVRPELAHTVTTKDIMEATLTLIVNRLRQATPEQRTEVLLYTLSLPKSE